MSETTRLPAVQNQTAARTLSPAKATLSSRISDFVARYRRDAALYKVVLKSYENELPFWLWLQAIRPLMLLTTPKYGAIIPPLEELRKLEPGTLGREVYEFFTSHNFKPYNVGCRRFQLHDCLHVIMGYETDPAGEAEFHAFILGSKTVIANHPGILYYVSMARVWKRSWAALERGWKSTIDPDRWPIEQEWHLPLVELRKRYNM